MNTRERIITHIMAEHRDPADWLLAARALCERCALNPARCVPLGVPLAQVAFEIIEEAQKHGLAVQARLDALLGPIDEDTGRLYTDEKHLLRPYLRQR